MIARCMSRYERHEPDDVKTHTCDLEAPHVADGPHHCPTCGAWWKAFLGVADYPTATTRPDHTDSDHESEEDDG